MKKSKISRWWGWKGTRTLGGHENRVPIDRETSIVSECSSIWIEQKLGPIEKGFKVKRGGWQERKKEPDEPKKKNTGKLCPGRGGYAHGEPAQLWSQTFLKTANGNAQEYQGGSEGQGQTDRGQNGIRPTGGKTAWTMSVIREGAEKKGGK